MTHSLIAVSGGTDSMALLYKMRKKKNLVVAHVNYNVRIDSLKDEKIVEYFCKENNIKFEVLSVNKPEKIKNFQAWARDIRYEFFKKIYDKYECQKVYTAHHNDDFLETAEMQARSGRTPNYFGIKRKNAIHDMNVIRPFINKFWKNDLLDFLEINKIPYAIDSSNEKPIYERNKIRIELNEWTRKEKIDRFKWYKMSNKILVKKQAKVKYLYKRWESKKFLIAYFNNCLFKRELIYDYVHENYDHIKLSTSKIDSIISFIEASRGETEYLLGNGLSIRKTSGLLIKVSK